MNLKELIEIIKTGEGYTIEFKESLSGSISKEICAFANSSGGKIILGVRDDGTIRGYDLSNKDKSTIQDIARNMDPSFHITVDKVDNLAIIYVPEGKEKPYSVNGHFYLRQGSNSQQLKRDEIRGFFQRENLIHFDSKANTKFDMKTEFNSGKFKEFVKKAGIAEKLSQEHILQNLGLMTDNKLNNAGVLFFSKNISKFFLNASIACVVYLGKTKTKILDKQEFDKDLISNFNNAVQYTMKNLRTEYIIEKIEREEKPEIPEKVLRELIINAIIHRDYFSNGRIVIEIYSDRVEISNPGRLFFKTTDLGRMSFARNPLFVDLVHRLKIVERIGSGIKRVQDIMGDKISFETSSDWFFVKITRKMPNDELVEKLVDKLVQKLTENQVKILKLIEEDSHITKSEISKKLKISTTAIDNNILKLKQKGLIERIGPDKGGYWKIIRKE